MFIDIHAHAYRRHPPFPLVDLLLAWRSTPPEARSRHGAAPLPPGTGCDPGMWGVSHLSPEGARQDSPGQAASNGELRRPGNRPNPRPAL